MIRFAVVLVAVLAASSSVPAQDRPLPPKAAAQAMTLPRGFKSTLFAGEPDLVQPIAFTFDDRGRVWVVECLSYPKPKAARVSCLAEKRAGCRRRRSDSARFEVLADHRAMRAAGEELEY